MNLRCHFSLMKFINFQCQYDRWRLECWAVSKSKDSQLVLDETEGSFKICDKGILMCFL